MKKLKKFFAVLLSVLLVSVNFVNAEIIIKIVYLQQKKLFCCD